MLSDPCIRVKRIINMENENFDRDIKATIKKIGDCLNKADLG